MGTGPREGYTLIEMAVVVVIISILFSGVAVRFDTLTEGSRLRASSREVGDTVTLAFSQALVTREKHTLVFETESGAYWIATEDDPDGTLGEAVAKRRHLYRGVRFKDVQVGQTVYEEEGEVKIDVSPLGISSSFVVHLQNDQEKEMTLRVNPLTGTVTYYDEYVDYEDAFETAVDTWD